MIAGFLALEQPDTWSRAPPISAENVEKPRPQHGVSFLAAFAHLDVDQHPRAVDGGDPQTRDFLSTAGSFSGSLPKTIRSKASSVPG
jgi:hypothetical protein